MQCSVELSLDAGQRIAQVLRLLLETGGTDLERRDVIETGLEGLEAVGCAPEPEKRRHGLGREGNRHADEKVGNPARHHASPGTEG